jgi:ferric-dicitrate binding protein FerR (iron transport regulator)
MKNLNQSTIDQLIQAFAEAKISRKDILQLERWVWESEENRKYFLKYKNILDNSIPLNINNGHALEKVLDRFGTTKQAPVVVTLLLKIAAILVIPLIISTLILWASRTADKRSMERKMVTLQAAFGTVSSFSLDDGSEVWLNAGSSLQFPAKFTGGKRVVFLTGEAYFEVKSNGKEPFIVQSGQFSVQATGTRFNVMSYADQSPSVTLAEGMVTVFIDIAGKESRIVRMIPDQHITFNPARKEIIAEHGDTYKHFSWKDGKLIFRNDLMADVMQRISVQYNVDIEITDDILLQNRYRATFNDESLTDVLDLLQLASPFEYLQINPVCLSDGSYSRKKIIISKSSPVK